MNLIIVIVGPIPYYRICTRLLCESIDCELWKKLAINLQSKPDLQYLAIILTWTDINDQTHAVLLLLLP